MIIEREDRHLPTEDGDVFIRRWRTNTTKAPIVLLHDSLGCVELWRDFPERLAAATARDVIAYDRLGFGRSAPHPGGWSTRFIRDEAERFFLPVWGALDAERFIAFGHSVGGAMAASLAAHHSRHCLGVITESAQAFVEDCTLHGIHQAQAAFAAPDQLDRLRKYHGEKAEWVLSAWFDTWLSDAYAGWTLEDSAPSIACPLLALHGAEDEYGSAVHPRRIAELATGAAQTLMLDGCYHVPHREQPEVVLTAVRQFVEAMP